jgi:type II secretory pathway pseudopilin PulG
MALFQDSKSIQRLLQSPHRRRTGATFYEILAMVVMVGILTALAMPFLLGQYQEDRTQNLQRDNTANDIIRSFQATRMEKGLIPRSLGPSDIILARLNQNKVSSHTTNDLPAGCENKVAVPAREMQLGSNRIKVFLSENWTEDSAGDFSEFCVQDTVLEEASVHRVYREGDAIGVLNSSAGNSATLTETGSNAQSTTFNVNSVEDAAMTGETRVIPRFVSVYTNNNLTTQLQGTTYTLIGPGGSTNSGQGALTVSKPGRYTLRIDSFPSRSGRAYLQNGPNAVVDIPNCYNPGSACEVFPTVRILDSYRLTVTVGSPYANEGDVPTTVNLHLRSNQGGIQDRPVTIRTYHDVSWMLPAGVYFVTISGIDVRSQALNNLDLLSSPQRYTAFLSERNVINILGVGADSNTSMPFSNSMTALLNGALQHNDSVHVGIFQHFLPLVGDGLYLVGNGATPFFKTFNHHNQYYMGVGLQDEETGQVATDTHQFVSTMTPIPSASGNLFKGPPPENRTYRSRSWATPVKLHMGMNNVAVNDDDHFLMDIDGFTENNTAPIMTPGGLNANEAWLILDRNHNGTWQNNALDNDDLFGDHLGRVKNGYVDLEKTFAHEIKTDAKGNKYIDLRDYNVFGQLQIQFSRTFLGDTVPYAAYDLQLLTRDRRLVPARESVDKIYVTYWDVQEYDKSGLNAIFQRAWVHYKNGSFKTSGDEYYALPNGIYEEVVDPEATTPQTPTRAPKPAK